MQVSIRRHVIAMGIHQFSADQEYSEMFRRPDLDEQRRDLLEYNIYAKNNAAGGLLHVVVKRSCNIGDMRESQAWFLKRSERQNDERGASRRPKKECDDHRSGMLCCTHPAFQQNISLP